MEMHTRKDPTLVYANIGVRAEVEITTALDRSEEEGAAIHIEHNGPELVIDFADPGGARRFRDRIATNDGATTSNDSNLLIGTGAAR